MRRRGEKTKERQGGRYQAVKLVKDFDEAVVAALFVFDRFQGAVVAHVNGTIDEGKFIFGNADAADYGKPCFSIV